MKKTFIGLLILVLSAWAQYVFSAEPIQLARMNGYVAAGVGAASCDYAICSAGCKLFSWDAASTTISGESGGSEPCSMGDKTATLGGEADLTSNVGYITLLDTSNNGNDNYKFATSAYDIFPSSDLTVEMTINLSAITNGGVLLDMFYDSNNYFIVSLLATNDIRVRHRGAGATVVDKAFDVNLSTGTSYNLVIKASTTHGMALSINGGSSYTTDVTKTITTMTNSGTTSDGFRVGNDAAYNIAGTITNIRISSGWRSDI